MQARKAAFSLCCSGSDPPVEGRWQAAAGLHVTRVRFLGDDGSEVPSQPVGMEGISEVVFWTGGCPTQTIVLMQCRRRAIGRATLNASLRKAFNRRSRLVESRYPASMARHGSAAMLCSQAALKAFKPCEAAGAASLLIRAGPLYVQYLYERGLPSLLTA